MRPWPILFGLALGLAAPACDDMAGPVPLGWGDPRTFPTRIEIDQGFQADDGADVVAAVREMAAHPQIRTYLVAAWT